MYNCSKCKKEFTELLNKNLHEKRCKLTPELMEIIRNDYQTNNITHDEIIKKYKIPKRVIRALLKDLTNKYSHNQKKIWNNEENIKNIVKISNSISEVLRNLGLLTFAGKFRTFHKYCKIYEINITHLYNDDKYKKDHSKKTIEVTELLTENSNFSSNHLKKRLYSIGLKEKKCENPECGITHWLNKEIIFQLHHRNGINTDNRIENLQILCPNCHTQTSNYGGKSLKKQRIKKIKIAKVKKVRPSKEESYIKRRKVERPSLEILLKNVEELGYRGTGKLYNVSDNAIRKWINLYNKKLE